MSYNDSSGRNNKHNIDNSLTLGNSPRTNGVNNIRIAISADYSNDNSNEMDSSDNFKVVQVIILVIALVSVSLIISVVVQVTRFRAILVLTCTIIE